MSGVRKEASRAASREEVKAAPSKDPKAVITTKAENEESIGLKLVRACSEALAIAVAKTLTSDFASEMFLYREEIKHSPYSDQEPPTKFLI